MLVPYFTTCKKCGEIYMIPSGGVVYQPPKPTPCPKCHTVNSPNTGLMGLAFRLLLRKIIGK
jgi:hypothetical protein